MQLSKHKLRQVKILTIEEEGQKNGNLSFWMLKDVGRKNEHM